MTDPSPRDNSLVAIALITLSFFVFSVASAGAKMILPTYSVGQMMLIRSLVALVLLSPFIIREGMSAIRSMPRPKLQILRAALSAIEVASFFWSVSYLPLADTVTIFLAGPLFVTLWSVLFLGERVGWRRWTAVIIGFAGVMIALRPSAALISAPALIALGGTMLYAVGVLTTRTLRGTAESWLTATQMIAAFVFGLIYIALAPGGWKTPPIGDFAVLVFLGIPTAMGYLLINRALRRAPASIVAPYQYTLIIWAALFGYFLFGDVPPLTTGIGACIIVGAGLYIAFRERALGKPAPPVEPV